MYIYCLIHVHSWFVTNSDTMYGKCRILRLKISVPGYRTVQSDWWVLLFHSGHTASDGLWRQTQNAPPKHSHSCTRLYGVLTHQTALWILTNVSTSNPVPKHTQNWHIDGNVTLGKLIYIETSSTFFLEILFNITHFFHQLCKLCVPQKLRKWTVTNTNANIGVRTMKNFNSTKIIWQGKLIFDDESFFTVLPTATQHTHSTLSVIHQSTHRTLQTAIQNTNSRSTST